MAEEIQFCTGRGTNWFSTVWNSIIEADNEAYAEKTDDGEGIAVKVTIFFLTKSDLEPLLKTFSHKRTKIIASYTWNEEFVKSSASKKAVPFSSFLGANQNQERKKEEKRDKETHCWAHEFFVWLEESLA